jgi:hypothetical protein
MSENKGFLYESQLNKSLKKYKVQRKDFQPAGADSNAPDAEIRVKGQDYKVEVKLDTKVDFGQGSLDYDLKNKKWILGGANTSSAQEMRSFLTSIGVLKIVNDNWNAKSKGIPKKFTVETSKFTKKDVDNDYTKFKDFFVDIPSNAVARYYNSKKTYYIQIGGGKGLYYMGSDPAKIGCPEFTLKLRLRVRLKRGGSNPINNYRFTTAIQAVAGSLHQSTSDLDDPKFLTQLAAM